MGYLLTIALVQEQHINRAPPRQEEKQKMKLEQILLSRPLIKIVPHWMQRRYLHHPLALRLHQQPPFLDPARAGKPFQLKAQACLPHPWQAFLLRPIVNDSPARKKFTRTFLIIPRLTSPKRGPIWIPRFNSLRNIFRYCKRNSIGITTSIIHINWSKTNRLKIISNRLMIFNNRLTILNKRLTISSNRLVILSNRLSILNSRPTIFSSQLMILSNWLMIFSNRLTILKNRQKARVTIRTT